MKHVLYVHARLTPLVVATTQALVGWLGRRLAPLLLRAMPGERGKQIALLLLWLVGLLCQAIMLWLLAELVDLAIGLYELWAIMAGKFVELDN